MTQQPFPFPSAEPLERLRIHDDLIINAERWSFAHSYHRQRQNLVYRSLNQPGIVTGLGVKKIKSPENVSSRGQNKSWLEIQPGIAIDINGNPIVVNSSTELLERCYPVAAIAPKLENNTTNANTIIYIYIQYRDPEKLEINSNSEKTTEGFKITHGFQPPIIENGEIELCRIKMEPGLKELQNPDNPLLPKINEIDLTHRIQAHYRPLAYVRVGCVNGVVNQVNKGLKALVDSLGALFPTLQASVYEQEINISLDATCDLVYLSEKSFYNLQKGDIELDILKNFLNTGGTILIEVDVFKSEFENFLQQNLLSSEAFINWSDLELHNLHLLKHPFLFTQLPIFHNQQLDIKLSRQGKIILVTEPFSAICSGTDLNRSDIRVAHEFGINLLYFAWQRRFLSDLSK
jgi:hypothetical protein